MSNSMNVVRGISQSLCLALLLLTSGALSAQKPPAPNDDHHVPARRPFGVSASGLPLPPESNQCTNGR